MTQQQDRVYTVAYGYSQKFKLSEKQAQDLVKATEQGAKIVKFDDLVLSTNYSWIAPQELVDVKELDSSDLRLCEDAAEWLSRDVNGLGWSYEAALDYCKKLINRVGGDNMAKLWRSYALGAYPSVKRFLMEAKQVNGLNKASNGEDEEDALLLGGGNNE